ncbi:MAG: hypothetical protein AB7N91_05480 [Candidatus Tectimicrobiota bacterium]
MSIGQVLTSWFSHGQAQSRPTTPGREAGHAESLETLLEAEIVQLALRSDGIWHPVTALESASSTSQRSARTPFTTRQLASSGLRLYLPTGQTQVRTPTVGLTIDTYV